MNAQPAAERETLRCEDPFDRWAEVYDMQENPFFSLEQQVLEDVLPELHGANVLDAGCGTGRLFAFFRERGARTLAGVDSSVAMVRRAAAHGIAEVVCGSCDALPLKDENFDVAVASFVLSYVSDLEVVAAEMMRVCKPGAAMIVSDMHPDTAYKLGWKRTFRYENEAIYLPWFRRNIIEIVKTFEKVGWDLEICQERAFTQRESSSFDRAGKSQELKEIQKYPALFVLRLRKKDENLLRIHLTGARCAVSANEASPANITIVGEKISGITSDQRDGCCVSLEKMMILPGLINAHDHLEFGLYPRLGRGPYQNATDWGEDIQQACSQEIAKQKCVSREIRAIWGAIVNLLCGVTTVCHHNPLLPEMLVKDFPVEVVRSMRWAHSLAIETDLCGQANQGDPNTPFIMHAAEGVDASASDEFEQLQSMGLIGPHTVLVHGLALSTEQASRVNLAGAAVILCPSSNHFLFDRVPSTELVQQLERLALGSDSPLTATGDLLDEVRCAKRMLGIEAERLYGMVTEASAKILGLHNGEGSIVEDGVANLIAVKDFGESPAETLMQLSWLNVELVVRRGRVFLASGRIYEELPDALRCDLKRLSINGEERWILAPLVKIVEQSGAAMCNGSLTLTGREVRYVAA